MVIRDTISGSPFSNEKGKKKFHPGKNQIPFENRDQDNNDKDGKEQNTDAHIV
jgi:hypothetical protein